MSLLQYLDRLRENHCVQYFIAFSNQESEVAQSCPTLCDPMDCSLPVSSIHGIFQARILEWVAFPSPGDLPNPGIVLGSPALQADALPSEPPGTKSFSLISQNQLISWRFYTADSMLSCVVEPHYLPYKTCCFLGFSLERNLISDATSLAVHHQSTQDPYFCHFCPPNSNPLPYFPPPNHLKPFSK